MNRASLDFLVGKNNLVGCEIGTWYGENAYDILTNLHILKMYLVDSYPNRTSEKDAKKLLLPFNDKIVWLRKRSQDVTMDDIPLNSLDFIYIDGDHSYDGVKKDLTVFFPMMKVGSNALFAGHDYGRAQNIQTKKTAYVKTGVKQAVSEFCEEHGLNEPFHELRGEREDWWVFLP